MTVVYGSLGPAVHFGYSARIVLDSLSVYAPMRLTTMELTYPRFVHAEFMTHRMFSRSSASSRAIPVSKMLSRVIDTPAMPLIWGVNQRGMQAHELLDTASAEHATNIWLNARDQAVAHARALQSLNVHKQLANRLLEPFLWHTVIVTGTPDAWANFFHLRAPLSSDVDPSFPAQPEIQQIALLARTEFLESKPRRRVRHQPYIVEDDWTDLDAWAASDVRTHDHLLTTPGPARYATAEDLALQVSAARCARVSYLNHNGVRSIVDDVQLFDRLVTSGHWAPLEHVAIAQQEPAWSGNFFGWDQLRKQYRNEFVTEVQAT